MEQVSMLYDNTTVRVALFFEVWSRYLAYNN